MKNRILTALSLLLISTWVVAQPIRYVSKFANENHPEIGYWFISPSLLPGDNFLVHLDTIAQKCP